MLRSCIYIRVPFSIEPLLVYRLPQVHGWHSRRARQMHHTSHLDKDKFFCLNYHGMTVCLGNKSPFITGSSAKSILPTFGSVVWIPRSFCMRCQTKSLVGFRRTNRPKTRTPWRAFTRSKADQPRGPAHQEINSIIQLRPIKKKSTRQTTKVRLILRKSLWSSRSECWFLAKHLNASSCW